MHVLRVRNVCEALPAGLEYLLREGRREESRAAPVLVAPQPVTTVYERPTERVLFSAVRDANPFFHLAESLWMLAGRNDAALLNNFVADFGARFAESASGEPNAEDDGRVHGAYGHRWRSALGFDQLDAVVERLRNNPGDRQCVIQMWDCTPWTFDLETVGCDDLRGDWRDRPCNTHVYLRVRQDLFPPSMGTEQEWRPVLDLTVCCRSNDVVWGAYGANAVHFSVLQEYLAARVGVGVGRMYQVSNNYHAYESELARLYERAAGIDHANVVGWGSLLPALVDQRYQGSTGLCPQPLVDDPEVFYKEVWYVLNAYESLGDGAPDAAISSQVARLSNKFLSGTVWPLLMAHRAYKSRLWPLVKPWLEVTVAQDWRVAAEEWVERRRK